MSNGWRDRLRRAIDATGRNHWFIAEQAAIDPTSLSRILNGHMEPKLEVIVRLAHACGVTVGWLLNERGYRLAPSPKSVIREAIIILDELTKD